MIVEKLKWYILINVYLDYIVKGVIKKNVNVNSIFFILVFGGLVGYRGIDYIIFYNGKIVNMCN